MLSIENQHFKENIYPLVSIKKCIKCICCDMYSTETYIMITIRLYECDLCYLVQDFYSLSKLLCVWGGGGGASPVSATVHIT